MPRCAVQSVVKGDTSVYLAPSATVTVPDIDAERLSAATRWLTCLYCNQKITTTHDRIEVNGKHEHAFINPVGVIYRIGCFANAPGVVEIGASSDNFTWFAGHVWRIALCGGCESHLGWTFAGAGHLFAGLVLNQLKLQDDSGALPTH